MNGVVTAEGESVFFFPFGTLFFFSYFHFFFAGSFFWQSIWPFTNLSVKRCFTAGNDGEIAAEVFCCPLSHLTVLLVTRLISIIPTTSPSICHNTPTLSSSGEGLHPVWRSLPCPLVISTSRSDIKQLPGRSFDWPWFSSHHIFIIAVLLTKGASKPVITSLVH